jgi:uncharacterized protein YcbX
MNMTVTSLWRYPVKTVGGEPIQTAEFTLDGIPGDRIVHVRGPEGVRTSRRFHRLLGLHGSLGANGEPLIDGLPWNSAEALALVRDAAGLDAWLEANGRLGMFDVLPLLIATDGAVQAFGRDVRRLRPNILIAGVDGMAEVDWPGATLSIGEAIIRLDSLRQRCPMTTVDPDTLQLDREVLRDINNRFGGRLALNAAIIRPGSINTGDTVSLIRRSIRSRSEKRS